MQARITNIALSTDAIEAGVRAVATTAPTKAFTTLKLLLLDQGSMPSMDSTLPVMLKELARCGDLESFGALCASVEGHIKGRCSGQDGSGTDARQSMQLLNLMLRCLAKLDVDESVRKADAWQEKGIVIESATYSQLAGKSLNAGNFEQAERMLEYRDYL